MATLIQPGSAELQPVSAPTMEDVRRLVGHRRLNRFARPDGSVWWTQKGGPAVLKNTQNDRARELASALYNSVGVYLGPVLITSAAESGGLGEA